MSAVGTIAAVTPLIELLIKELTPLIATAIRAHQNAIPGSFPTIEQIQAALPEKQALITAIGTDYLARTDPARKPDGAQEAVDLAAQLEQAALNRRS